MKTFGYRRQNRRSMWPCVLGQTPTWKSGCKLWRVESMASLEQRVKQIEDHLEAREANGFGCAHIWQDENGQTLAELPDGKRILLDVNWRESASIHPLLGPAFVGLGIKVVVGVDPDKL